MNPQTSPVESIDFRLAHNKSELDRIYAQQDEMLASIHPQLREDFCMTRADRIRELTEREKENTWLLQTWTF